MLTFVDTDGRKLKIRLRGWKKVTVTQLRRAKENEAKRAEEGLNFLGKPQPGIVPNPPLAKRLREMTLLEWLRYKGAVNQVSVIGEKP